MQYACLIYYDPKSLFGGGAEAQSVLDECESHDEKLQESGHFVNSVALVMPDEAMTVHVRDGRMSAVDGPFMETKEMLGGLVVIEARDLNEAVRVASAMPHARIGYVEVRPLIDFGSERPQL